MIRRALNHARAWLLLQARAWTPDAMAVAGWGLIGVGAGEFHPGLAPIVWGAGLVLAVRWGSGTAVAK